MPWPTRMSLSRPAVKQSKVRSRGRPCRTKSAIKARAKAIGRRYRVTPPKARQAPASGTRSTACCSEIRLSVLTLGAPSFIAGFEPRHPSVELLEGLVFLGPRIAQTPGCAQPLADPIRRPGSQTTDHKTHVEEDHQ